MTTTTAAPTRRPRNAKIGTGIDQLNARADPIWSQIVALFDTDEAAPVVVHVQIEAKRCPSRPH